MYLIFAEISTNTCGDSERSRKGYGKVREREYKKGLEKILYFI